ncbi:MAG: endonuclease [Candidatus Nanohaloarchaeota archaeon]|nr:endonuclease [Candidatus Nanohaloarchaeota archaeon]
MGKVRNLYNKLLMKHGPQNWWPCEGEKYGNDEIAIGAILTQNTSWKNVEKALFNLKKNNALSLEAIISLPLKNLAKLIQPSGFYNQKAERLKTFAHYIISNYGSLKRFFEHSDDVLNLREKLLSLKGIGKETADSILLYAGFKPIFVVDKYTYRLFLKEGILDSAEKFDYEKIRKIVEKEIKEVKDMQEFHALIVEEGKAMRKKS